jgi:hypothetical protein
MSKTTAERTFPKIWKTVVVGGVVVFLGANYDDEVTMPHIHNPSHPPPAGTDRQFISFASTVSSTDIRAIRYDGRRITVVINATTAS